MVAADRSANASLDAESLPFRGLAAYQVACALFRADRSDEAEHLAVSMAEQVQTQARSDAPTLVSVAGALWLIAAVIAARAPSGSRPTPGWGGPVLWRPCSGTTLTTPGLPSARRMSPFTECRWLLSWATRPKP